MTTDVSPLLTFTVSPFTFYAFPGPHASRCECATAFDRRFLSQRYTSVKEGIVTTTPHEDPAQPAKYVGHVQGRELPGDRTHGSPPIVTGETHRVHDYVLSTRPNIIDASIAPDYDAREDADRHKSKEERHMPAISMFYGLIVYMYFMDNKQHNLPHIHVKYQNDEVIVSIPEGHVLDGSLPSSKMKLLQAWIELHRDELVADWELAVTGEPPYKIEPLR